MEKAWGVLDTLDDVEPGVNAAYYGLAADYYKAGVHIAILIAHTDCCACRQRQNMLRITKTRCCTLHAWIRRRICHPRRGC